MYKHLIKLFLISWLCCAIVPAQAQKTLEDSNPEKLFKKGLDLFEAKHYASAEQTFTDYLKLSDRDLVYNRQMAAEAHYYIARSAMELFRDDAEALLVAFSHNYPEHPKAPLVTYYLGEFRFRNKNYEEAASTFESVDAGMLDRKETEAYHWMAGYANFKTENYDKAKGYLARIKDTPGEFMSIATYYYAFIAYINGKYNEALTEFLRIKEDAKFKREMPLYITQIYLLQGKYDQVIAEGETAMNDKSAENNEEIKLYVAEAYFKKKEYAKAESIYSGFRGKWEPHHLYQYGYAQYLAGNYTGAANTFNSIGIKEDSLGQNIAFNMGNAYLKAGDKLKARTAYDFAMRLDFIPDIKQKSLLQYSKLSFDMGNQTEAMDGLNKYISAYPNSPGSREAKDLLGEILISSGNTKDALQQIEKISNRTDNLNANYQKLLYINAIDEFNNRNFSTSIEDFRKSLQYPYDKKLKALAYFWIAEIQIRNKEYETAIINFKNFLYVGESKETPYYNLANYNIGYGYFKQENYQYAKTYFSKFVDNEKGSRKNARTTDAILRLADCNQALKDYPDAINGYNEVINSGTAEGDYALYQKAVILGVQGKFDEQISTLRNLVAKYKDSKLLDDAIFAIGEAYNNARNFDQAIKEFQTLNYNYPKNNYKIAALLNIGQAYFNLGQDAKAIGSFKEIIEKYPNSEESRIAIGQVQNIYSSQGNTEALRQFLGTLPETSIGGGKRDSALYSSAYNNFNSGNCDAAIRSFDTYLGDNSNRYFLVDAHYFRGECEYAKNMPAKALQDFNFVIAKSPNPYMEEALKKGGELYYKAKDYQFALTRYKQLEDVANQTQNVLLALNGQLRSYFYLGEHENVASVANKILALSYADDNTKREAQFFMAKSQLAMNQLDQAKANFVQIYKTEKVEMGSEAIYQAAYIEYLQERYDESQKLILELRKNYSSDYWKAKGLILLSDVFVKQNDYFNAKGILKSIISGYKGEELLNIAKAKLKEVEELEKNSGK